MSSEVGRWYSPISASVNTLLWTESKDEEPMAIRGSAFHRRVADPTILDKWSAK
jgi:hypothetical protein